MSYYFSIITRHPYISGMPPAIGIELTNYCNLRCPECPSGSGMLSRDRGYMQKDIFTKIINELKAYLFVTQFYLQGESLMHPRFLDFLEEASSCGVIISTNGHYFNDENIDGLVNSGASRIIVSIDGMDKDTYKLYRVGGDLDRVKQGTEKLAGLLQDKRKGPVLEIQFLVNRHNVKQIAQAREYAAKLNARFRLKSMQIINTENYADLLPESDSLSRYVLKDGSYKLKSKKRNMCLRLWTTPVITWDGRVLPCCFDKDARYQMGDINSGSFRDIWRGEAYSLFRKQILLNRRGIDMCNNCTEGLNKTVRI